MPSDIRSRLEQDIRNDALSFTASHAELLNLESAFRDFALPNDFIIQVSGLESDGGRTTLRGSAQFFNSAADAIEILCDETSETARTRLLLTCSRDWRLSELFPSLPRQGRFKDGDFQYCENYLGEIPLKACTVLIETPGQSAPATTIKIMGQVGDLTFLTDQFPWVDSLEILEFSAVATLEPEGIRVHATVALKIADAFSELGVGALTLTIDSSAKGGPSGVQATGRLQGRWDIGTQHFDFATELTLGQSSPYLTVSAGFESNSEGTLATTLSDTLELFGIPFDTATLPLEDVIPDVVPNRILLALDVSRLTLSELTVFFTLRSPWQLLPGSVEIPECTLGITVLKPFDSNRRLSLSGYGDISLGRLSAKLSYFSAGNALQIRRSTPLDVQQLLENYANIPLPIDLPQITSLAGTIDPTEPRFSFRGELGPGLSLKLGKYDLDLARASLRLDATPARARKGRLALAATARIAGELATVTANFGSAARFTFGLSQLSLGQLFDEAFGVPLPDWLQFDLQNILIELTGSGNFTLHSGLETSAGELLESAAAGLPIPITGLMVDSLELGYTRSSGEWSVKLSGNSASAPVFEGSGVGVRTFALTLKGGGAESGIVIDVTADGRFKISEDTELMMSGVGLTWNSGSESWHIEGEATARFLGHRMALAVTGDATPHQTTWQFSLPQPEMLADWDQVCAIEINALGFGVTQIDDRYQFEATGDIEVSVHSLMTLGFDVVGATTDDVFGLRIESKLPEIREEISLPSGLASLTLTMKNLGLDFKEDEGLLVSGQASMSVEGVPTFLARFFPEQVDGRIAIGKGGFVIEGDVDKAIDFPHLKLTLASGVGLDLGKPSIDLQKMRFEIYKDSVSKARKVELGAVLDIQASGFNNLFGKTDAGQPKVAFMNPHFGLAVLISDKPKLRLLSSPFKDLSGQLVDRRLVTQWDFGTFGALELQVPEFSWEGGNFSASGGFSILRDIKLPFFAFKWLLEKMGVSKAVTGLWPDALPIVAVDLEETSLRSFLEAIIGIETVRSLDEKCQGAITYISNSVEDLKTQLPERMGEYLRLELPRKLNFEIAAGGSASSVKLIADPDNPVKLLIPSAAPLPELIGVSFRKLGIGQFLGGQLFTLEIDADVDRFDLLSVFSGLTTPISARNITNHYTFRDVLAVGPTAAPVPIPILFSEISWEYHDIFGMRLETHWLSERDFDLSSMLPLFMSLKEFFLDPNYLLHDPKNKNDKINWSLKTGPSFIAPPDALGMGTLGDPDLTLDIDLYDAVSRLFDALKTGNAGYLIEAVPLRHGDKWIRIGKGNLVRFGPVEISATWCISTDEEYKNILLVEEDTRALLEEFNGKAMLRALPSDPQKVFEQGFIILLGGRWELADFLQFDCKFGTALTGGGQFGLGVLMEGAIPDIFTLTFQGDLDVKPSAAHYSLAGHQSVTLFGQTILDTVAEVAFDKNNLRVGIALQCGSMQLADAELILGVLPSGAAGMAIAFEWFNGGSRQAFELGYHEGQLALLAQLTVIRSKAVTINGHAILSIGVHGVLFDILAEIDFAGGFITGHGRALIENGSFEIELGTSLGGLGCIARARAEVDNLYDSNFNMQIAFDLTAINAIMNELTSIVASGLSEAQAEVDGKRAQLEKNKQELENVTLNWENFRGPFNEGVKAANRIVQKRIADLPWAVRQVSGPFTKPYFSAIAEFQKRMNANWKNFTWQDVNSWLDAALKTSMVRIPYYVPFEKKVYRKDLLGAANRKKFIAAKTLIKDLRGPIDFAINAREASEVALQVADKTLYRAQSLTSFGIRSVSIDANIGAIDKPGLKCTVVMDDGKSESVVFLPSPKELATSLYKAIA